MYTPDFEALVRAWAETVMAPDRIAHTRGVVETADALARCYAPDQVARVRLAGWIHDVAKHWDDDALLAYAESHSLPITLIEREMPMLLHGAVAYALAADRFGLDDARLASACALHTTGSPDMTVTDKIVFLADLIEPGRDFREVETLRDAARHDLGMAMLHAADYVIRHLIHRRRLIDPRVVALRNRLIRENSV